MVAPFGSRRAIWVAPSPPSFRSGPSPACGRGPFRSTNFVGATILGSTRPLHVLREDETFVDQDQGPSLIPFVESPLCVGYEPSRSSNLLTLPLRKLAPSDRAQERPSLLQLRLHLGVDRAPSTALAS